MVVAGALVAVPVFGYYVAYTWIDWALLVVLYFASGLGITVGYHRLIAHRSFECKPWVKVALLIAGGWALQNSACKWAADHVRHHAKCDREEDPYNATLGFWHSHVLWIFYKAPFDLHEKYEAQFRKDPIVMWQHRYYAIIVLSGLTLPASPGCSWSSIRPSASIPSAISGANSLTRRRTRAGTIGWCRSSRSARVITITIMRISGITATGPAGTISTRLSGSSSGCR
jgi:hypothetical protein